ncbi:DUF2141 domain-containing protein [Mariniflexile ostreae]|uniref:DUF2141 domain-containing protein n=1 Tax=Mariniflexile ostreae TaxID=1520892 RepID=A0ABV5FGS5_9FLAO
MIIFVLYVSILINFFSINNPELTIEIQNIEVSEGEIIIGVFNTGTRFLREGAAIKNYTIAADETTKTLVIKDLPKGVYAISMYHDENSDGICNRNFIGIPKEPYGFSNNIKPKFSAPSYEDCKFSFQKDSVLKIKLRN